MASFFQPPSNDPALENCDISRFQVYCNPPLSAEARLRTPHQLVLLLIAAVSTGVPLAYWATRYTALVIVSKVLGKGEKKVQKAKKGQPRKHSGRIISLPALKTATSFQFLTDDELRSDGLDLAAHDILIVPVPFPKGKTAVQVRSKGSVMPPRLATVVGDDENATLIFGHVQIDALPPTALSDGELRRTADLLAAVYEANSLAGLAIRCCATEKQKSDMDNISALFALLSRRSIPLVAVSTEESPALDRVNFAHVVGVVIENGLVLRSGQRRDYFRSSRTRDVMAWCASQRELRPDFFVGFWDLWEARPTPALMRRAVKLAEHFGAVYEHGPSVAARSRWEESVRAATTVSGFEYLRRTECTELLKAWAVEKKPVRVPTRPARPAVSLEEGDDDNDNDGTTHLLPAPGLEQVLPEMSTLLAPHPLPPELLRIQLERPMGIGPPDYVDNAPSRYSFWDVSPDEADLCTWGCFPLTSCPTKEQYDAIVDVQVRLRRLRMLQQLEGGDTQKIMQRLEALLLVLDEEYEAGDGGIDDDDGEFRDMVDDLIVGLTSGQICVLKGLDTGFGIPDDEDAKFWALSTVRGEDPTDRRRDAAGADCVDIYVSLKAPWDAGVVLNAWLAHNGVSRERRYEAELRLEQTNNMDIPYGLPFGIRASIEHSTTAELLLMLEQLRVSDLEGPFRPAIEAMTRDRLIGDTNRAAWRREHSLGWLDGSITMEELLTHRLEEFARRGAVELPRAENLAALYRMVEELVEDALSAGDRETLGALESALTLCYGHGDAGGAAGVDVATDLFALIFFAVLRRAAIEDVYVEATDRCPYFLSQPDQAAVFAELWVLGSQCELYFCILPREVGQIVFDRYHRHLQANPPPDEEFSGGVIMTMYSNAHSPAPDAEEGDRTRPTSVPTARATTAQAARMWKRRIMDFGAMSIFCLPAILDVILLTFVGRGLFMTAFMTGNQLTASAYALLVSLLLTAGVTGWVGSTGNFYLPNYAYDNMIFFHVQRLSGGLVLTIAVGLAGLLGFAVHNNNYQTGLIFVAYLVLMTTYFNLLGIMATMHQQGSPHTSGRTVLWRTIPVLFVSPVLSTFVPGHDVQIYMPIGYVFLVLLLVQYRALCREWAEWMDNLPKVSEAEILKWYAERNPPQPPVIEEGTNEEDGKESPSQEIGADALARLAQEAFRNAVANHEGGGGAEGGSREKDHNHDPLVQATARSMPYVDWLFLKTVTDSSEIPDKFTGAWFTQLSESARAQQQLRRGLKEHNALLLFRMARHDLGQNLGLFLVALMDRWVSITTSDRRPHLSVYTDGRARYGICFCLLFFCASVMILDATLQGFWGERFRLSSEKLTDWDHARVVLRGWEKRRRGKLLEAAASLFSKVMFLFGATSLLVWLTVESFETTLLFYGYALGYVCVVLFQFNRCFTTDVAAHVTSIIASSFIGYSIGVLLHILPQTAGSLYIDVAALDIAAAMAAGLTMVYAWKDFSAPKPESLSSPSSSSSPSGPDAVPTWVQPHSVNECDQAETLQAAQRRSPTGFAVRGGDGSVLAGRIGELLQASATVLEALPRNKSAAEVAEAAEAAAPQEQTASWPVLAVGAALRLWSSDRAVVMVVSSRAEFRARGLAGASSFSRVEGQSLRIWVGMMARSEVGAEPWQPLLATLMAEALLYHAARFELGADHDRAIHAEHIPVLAEASAAAAAAAYTPAAESPRLLSRRIDFELSLADPAALSRSRRRTNDTLLTHLCLGVPVDIEWEAIPQAGREVILARIAGDPVLLRRDAVEWFGRRGITLDTTDFLVDLSLAMYHKCRERWQSIVSVSESNRTSVSIATSAAATAAALSGPPAELRAVAITTRSRSPHGALADWAGAALAMPAIVVKWIAVVSAGGSNIERELWYRMRRWPTRVAPPALRLCLLVWKGCRLLRDACIYRLLIQSRPALARLTRLAERGSSRIVVGNAIVVEQPRLTLTGIASATDDDTVRLSVHEGSTKTTLRYRAVYDERFRLTTREDMISGGEIAITSRYHYAAGDDDGDGDGDDDDYYHYHDHEGERDPDRDPSTSHRWPISKEVAQDGFRFVGYYDGHGRIADGTLTLGGTRFAFRYYFRAAPRGSGGSSGGGDDVLRADFEMAEAADNDDQLSVYWGVPGRARADNSLGSENKDEEEKHLTWVPSERVCRIVRRVNGREYITTGEYQHRHDPIIRTVIEGADGTMTAVGRAPQVFPEENLLMTRPSGLSFDSDDLLIYHSEWRLGRMLRAAKKKEKKMRKKQIKQEEQEEHERRQVVRARAAAVSSSSWWRLNRWNGATVYRPAPTWRIRTELWEAWLRTGTLDAPTACWVDEQILRRERLLVPYWRDRDAGRLAAAKRALDVEIDQIVSAIEIEAEVSEVCLLPIRPSDLYAMGLSKDATQVTTRPEDCFADTDTRIGVVFNDVGCWPEAPGGVSNCRRDLVDGHSTIRNHVLAECANDFGIPRFQIEKNVQSIKLLPLWGLDGRTAHHGLLDNLLQSQVDDKVSSTHRRRDVVAVFVPLIRSFVRGARTRRYTREDLITYSNTILSLAKYLEHKDYNATWEAPEAERAWVEAWMTPYQTQDIVDPSGCFPIERPSMADFRDALGIYLAYFFIFSVQIPRQGQCPRVFQSTHHGISSLFGMLLKYRRGATFGIWDHAILWRECCLNISPAQCTLAVPVQSMLLAGIGLASRLAYFHADVIMPCTSLFNPMWETEIGTDMGRISHRLAFSRKIDPIVNGISNMDSFTPVDKVRTDRPTVIMLSNVQSIKGIKTAILAADVIVNRYGFRQYHLVVYGAKDRQPAYALEMARLIVERSLSENVLLAGFGKPREVLKDAWLFMNSSISEGLPLAIGEAALAGVPIVATEVGATALVLTDPNDAEQRYGEVVPPNDPLALARAQLSILSMVGPWVKFTTEDEEEKEEDDEDRPARASPPPVVLPEVIGPREVAWLSRRMVERTEDRRRLGLLSREVVLHSFHGNRYLREHEQMYWIQWHHSRMRAEDALIGSARAKFRFGRAPPLRYVEGDAEERERRQRAERGGGSGVGSGRGSRSGRASGSGPGGVDQGDGGDADGGGDGWGGGIWIANKASEEKKKTSWWWSRWRTPEEEDESGGMKMTEDEEQRVSAARMARRMTLGRTPRWQDFGRMSVGSAKKWKVWGSIGGKAAGG